MNDQQRIRWINDLFGDARQITQMSEVALFRRAFPQEDSSDIIDKLFACMRDVRACPPEVEAVALELIDKFRPPVHGVAAHLDAPIDCPLCCAGAPKCAA